MACPAGEAAKLRALNDKPYAQIAKVANSCQSKPWPKAMSTDNWGRSQGAKSSAAGSGGLSHRYVLRVGISGGALVLNSNIRAPVLILAPDGGPLVDRSIAADLHALIASSELHGFPRQQHSLLMSGAHACASAYVEFLKRGHLN